MNFIFRYVVTINHGTRVLFQPLATSTWKCPIHTNDCCKKKTKRKMSQEHRIEQQE